MTARMIERPAEVVVEVPNRWDAVDLTHRLPACRWFMVARDERRWEVHVTLEQARPRLREDLEQLTETWARTRLGSAGTVERVES